MSVVKVIELLADSDVSWEDAVRRAVKEASKTIKDIKSVYVEHCQAEVDDDEIVSFRVNVKISFVVRS